jgi:hypothetical protein
MIIASPFAKIVARPVVLAYIRAYWEDDPSDYWEAEAMSLGYQGA